jgi:hypothetical protein
MFPIGEFCTKSDGRQISAVRPFWSSEKSTEGKGQDILWPLYTDRDFWYDSYWRFLLYYNNGVDKEKSRGGGVFPIIFWGKDKEDNPYGGLFPIFGNLKDVAGYDRINFILFPCYASTSKDDVYGESYLWPIVNWDKGGSTDKFRVFPFYGYNHRLGQYYNEFYMWPFVTTAKSENSRQPGGGWMVWPIVGHNKLGKSDSWSYVWPFFRVIQSDDDSLFDLHCPWPFIQYLRNETPGKSTSEKVKKEDKLYIWPLWGNYEKSDSSYTFLLWPFFSYRDDRGETKRIKWLWILPLYWGKDAWDKDGEKIETYHRYWPFASYHETKEMTELRMFDIWPERNMKVIDRNLSPLWRIFRYYSEPDGSAEAWEFLWGVLSHCKSENGSRFNLFPFYNVQYDLKAESEEASETVRDILLGACRVSTKKSGKRVWRLFWNLEF